jgi:hypothetical protein
MSWFAKKYYYVTIWEWCILILALSVLILYVYGQSTAPNLEKYVDRNKHSLSWITVQKAFDIAENGDVVLLAGDTKGEKTCRWCTGTIFSHVGVLFWETHPVTGERILYVFECDLGQGTKAGVRVIPLRDKLHRYKGMRIGGLKKMIVYSPHPRPNRDDFVKLFPKYTPIEFDNKIATWWVANWKWLYNLVKDQKTMFCSELVTSVFQDLNIIKKDRVPAWYHPGDFHKNRLRLEDGYSFGETLIFEFPKSQTQLIVDSSLPVETGMAEFIGGDYTVLPGMEWLKSINKEMI